ncbi:2-nitropropane dioxygenase [Talaromyces proteolyticus]|uniref:2-nitropropane dioxygenase n=1 Tax=Talaromyces proteolyticus TaxID=1131652 RepID=A0AAD4PUW8_9EURO|nr:2-nitropropane dioxygenase [Talaromyces proteolyticus]KAH8695606.1 2-nitropropane dioxygenase [Talaromyces proteolyticus]
MFPHIISPLIVNAPMYGTATAALAAAVTKAGGFGFIGGGFDFTSSSAQLSSLEEQLVKARELLGLKTLPESNGKATDSLPIGVGFLTFHNGDASGLIPLIRRHRPAAVWLFAQAHNQHASLIKDIKLAGDQWNMKVFVQIGSVQSAIEAANDGADVIVVQGADAGGHQFTSNSSIVALLPEVIDVIENLHKEVSILAAGGIMDGRGIAAALALGASGVVMGTRFAATLESEASQATKSVLVSTQDGGISTVKSVIHDSLQGRGDLWPVPYDGRAVICDPYKKVLAGKLSVEQATDLQKKAASEGNTSGMVVWAGAGVGLIRDIESAGAVVERSRAETIRILKYLSKF